MVYREIDDFLAIQSPTGLCSYVTNMQKQFSQCGKKIDIHTNSARKSEGVEVGEDVGCTSSY